MTKKTKPAIQEVLNTLNQLVGQENIKREISKYPQTFTPREHLIMTGNPGTGKSTVARILADLFYAAEILPTNKIIQVYSKDLLGQYIGQTAVKVNTIIDEALGGILFIDGVSGLSIKHGIFCQDALETLISRMEQDLGKFICIVSDFPDRMETFLNEFPSFRNHCFNKRLHFKDYNPTELSAIYRLFAENNGYKLGDGWDQKTNAYFSEYCDTYRICSTNAWEAKKLFEISRASAAERCSKQTRDAEEEILKPDMVPSSDIPASKDCI